MNHALSPSLDAARSRLGSRATTWVLGTGLLSLHATVFTLAMVAMTLWNVYDAPNDLWVADVFRRWGALLAFHAIAVAAGWTAWKLMRAEQQAVDAAQRNWVASAVERPVFGADGAPPAAQPGWTAPQPTAPLQRYAGTAQRADVVARRVVTTSHALSVAAAKWTIETVNATTGRWTARRKGGQANGATVPTPNPMSTWPEAPRPRTDEEEFIARFGGGVVTTTETVTVTETVTTTAAAPDGGTDVVIDVTAAPMPDRPEAGARPTVHLAKDPNASWVETAAASWLPRFEGEPARSGENGHGQVRDAEFRPAPSTDTDHPPIIH